jgi:hypothetical protein
MFRHPKYYKELRKRNRDLSELQRVKPERSVPQSDQAISNAEATAASERTPDSGQTRTSSGSSLKRQAAGDKRHTASSAKRQASSPE